MNIAIFSYDVVGAAVTSWLYTNYKSHVKRVIYTYNKINTEELKNLDLDYIILAWWPYIIKKDVLKIPRKGVINLHPSLLPYERGKGYWFWNIVEDHPFGITIHLVDESIDGGDILFQKEIEKTWEDTGEALFNKAKTAIVNLFKESYSKLISGDFKPIKQTPAKVRYYNNIEKDSEIFLNEIYIGKDLLNLLRAKSSDKYPGCYFYDNGQKYEVKVKITKC